MLRKNVKATRIECEDDSLVKKLENLEYKLGEANVGPHELIVEQLINTSLFAIIQCSQLLKLFLRSQMSKELNSKVSFIAVDEAHLVRMWAKNADPHSRILGFFELFSKCVIHAVVYYSTSFPRMPCLP
jgi:hypothetical protein